MNEVRIIFIIAFAAVIVFMIGNHINAKKLDRYARSLENRAKDRKVKYAPYGTDGFKARIQFEEGAMTQLDLAFKLVDRYNFMHYLLSIYTKDSDTMAVWCRLRDETKKKLLVSRLNAAHPKQLVEEEKKVYAVFDRINDVRVNEVYDAILQI
ncbi:MAG: hypothetical protein ABH874_05435 [Methanobacteriota archaeon]